MKPLNNFPLAVLVAAVFVAGCASNRRVEKQEIGNTSQSDGADRATKGKGLNNSNATLRQALEEFIQAADKSDSATVAGKYAQDFVNIRITDEGDVVRLDRAQLLSLLGRAGGHHVPTKSTKIQHIEVVGDTGFVLLTRVKDLGNGWETMFYSLVWKREVAKWLLAREFVHQRSLPKKP